MASQWHYRRGGEQHGPLTSTQLKELSAGGRLVKTDLVWKEGMAHWLPAGQLKGLFPDGAGLTPPATQVSAARPAGNLPPIPPIPPQVPPTVQAAVFPLPPKSQQPQPVPLDSSAGQNPSNAQAGASTGMRSVADPGAAEAGRNSAAGPTRIGLGKTAVPRWAVIAALSAATIAVLLIVGVGGVILRPKSKSESLAGAGRPKPFAEQILGEWKGVNEPVALTFQKDQVVVGDENTASRAFPYQVDEAGKVATLKISDTDTISARLEDDGRLYTLKAGTDKVVVLAREYKGGWHTKGEIVPGDQGGGRGGTEPSNREQASGGMTGEQFVQKIAEFLECPREKTTVGTTPSQDQYRLCPIDTQRGPVGWSYKKWLEVIGTPAEVIHRTKWGNYTQLCVTYRLRDCYATLNITLLPANERPTFGGSEAILLTPAEIRLASGPMETWDGGSGEVLKRGPRGTADVEEGGLAKRRPADSRAKFIDALKAMNGKVDTEKPYHMAVKAPPLYDSSREWITPTLERNSWRDEPDGAGTRNGQRLLSNSRVRSA